MNFAGHLKIEEVGGALKAEQVDDDVKKAHCVQSFDKTEYEAKMLEISLLTTRSLRFVRNSCLTRMTASRSCKSRSLSFMPAWLRPLGSNRLSILISSLERRQCSRDAVAQALHQHFEQFLHTQARRASTEGRSCAVVAS